LSHFEWSEIPGAGHDLELTRAGVLAKIRTARDAGIISDDYARTLIELVELLSDHEPQV